MSFPQEYICVKLDSLQSSFRIFLSTNSESWSTEVTANHILLGYKPLIIGISVASKSEEASILKEKDFFCLHFNESKLSFNHLWHGRRVDRKSVATLLLKKVKQFEFEDITVFIVEGEDARHHLISIHYQRVNNFFESYKKRKSGNVDLAKNLYEQVRIAYAFPRKISLISLGSDQGVNAFSTDLHGQLSEKFYVSSLRIGGMATRQVEQHQTIVLSDIDSDFYQEAYALGKNHVANLQSTSAFGQTLSAVSHGEIPIPHAAIRYKVLNRVTSFDCGIHRIHFYEIQARKELKDGYTLAHIHRYYAQWRENHKIDNDYLFR